MQKRTVLLAVALGFALGNTAFAEVILEDYWRGYWRSDGVICIDLAFAGDGDTPGTCRAAFVFDLMGVPSTVTSLRARLEVEHYFGNGAPECFVIKSVEAPGSTLLLEQNSIPIFDDLGDGDDYSDEVCVFQYQVGSVLEIPLNAQAVADLSAAVGGDGYFSLGVLSTSIDGSTDPNGEEGVRFAFDLGDPTAYEIELVLGFGSADCNDSLDNDGDGLVDFFDPGCVDTDDASEREATLPCDDGVDNDGDGWIDYIEDLDLDGISDLPGDPVCANPSFSRENAQCQDGLNNDGQLGTDYDGGVSINGAGGADPNGADPDCVGRPWNDREKTSKKRCGLGFEIGLAVPLLLVLGARHRRKGSPRV